MKAAARKILSGTIILLLIAAGAAAYVFSTKERARRTCQALKVEISTGLGIVDPEQVKKLVDRSYGVYVGQKLDSIALYRIEKSITEGIAAVNDCEVYVTDDDTLRISIAERVPVLKFTPNGRESFLVDRNGQAFPNSRSFAGEVLSVKGNIPASDAEWVASMIETAEFLKKKSTLKNCAVEMEVDNNGNLSIRSDKMTEIIRFGAPSDAEDKFRRLENYQKYIKPLDKGYKTVTLMYKDQIICK